MEPDEQGGDAPKAPEQTEQVKPPSQPRSPQPRSRDDDDTWGLGSAAAMDTLRRRNFRGRRGEPGGGRPSSE